MGSYKLRSKSPESMGSFEAPCSSPPRSKKPVPVRRSSARKGRDAAKKRRAKKVAMRKARILAAAIAASAMDAGGGNKDVDVEVGIRLEPDIEQEDGFRSHDSDLVIYEGPPQKKKKGNPEPLPTTPG